MANMQEEIEAIVVDAYGQEEEMVAWEVAFQDGVRTPFKAKPMGMPVVVCEFRVSDNLVLQCLAARGDRERWIGIEDLDEEGLPEDFQHVMALYRAWQTGDY